MYGSVNKWCQDSQVHFGRDVNMLICYVMHPRQVCLVSVFLHGIQTEVITHGGDTDCAAVQSVFLKKKKQQKNDSSSPHHL